MRVLVIARHSSGMLIPSSNTQQTTITAATTMQVLSVATGANWRQQATPALHTWVNRGNIVAHMRGRRAKLLPTCVNRGKIVATDWSRHSLSCCPTLRAPCGCRHLSTICALQHNLPLKVHCASTYLCQSVCQVHGEVPHPSLQLQQQVTAMPQLARLLLCSLNDGVQVPSLH